MLDEYVIIVAGGTGSRMKNNIPKQFLEIKGKPILQYTIEKFKEYNGKINIILALAPNYIDYWKKLALKKGYKVDYTIVKGGTERFFTVKNALEKVPENAIVAIHDAVRPLVSLQVIKTCFATAKTKGCAVPFIKEKNSVRQIVSNENKIIDRSSLALIQTPQCFHSQKVKKAYQKAKESKFTDDASVFEADGNKVFLIEGNEENIKITTQLDLKVLEILIG